MLERFIFYCSINGRPLAVFNKTTKHVELLNAIRYIAKKEWNGNVHSKFCVLSINMYP
jgi:hypothetical protein